MKKVFGIISIVSILSQATFAQDTVRLCQPMPPYPPPGGTDLSNFCPSGPLGPFFFGILNGDTIVGLGSFTNASAGTQGMMYVYCDQIVDGTPDTVFYFIGNALPQICVISSDSNNHPVIYVDSSTLYGNDVVLLQRQVTTTSWNTVTNFHPSNPLIIVDSSANTATQSYTYRVSSSSYCIGYQHSTIHLQSNGNNLIWNQYQGGLNPLRGYYIYKRDINGNFLLIDSTVSLTYTDINFQNGDEYFVEAYKDDGCQTNSWQKTSSPISVRSNKLKIGTSGINTPEQTRIKYYVDGSTLFVELIITDDVWIHDLVGREIIHQRTDNLNVQLKTGVYLMNVGTKGYKVVIH